MFEELEIQKIVAEVEIPYLLRLEDSFGQDPPEYQVEIEGYDIGLNIKKVPKGTDSVRMAVQSHSDRLGRVSATRCRAHFDESYISGVLDQVQGSPIGPDPTISAGSGRFSQDEQPRKIVSDFVLAINKLLQSYRTVTEEYWLRSLFVEELLHFRITGIDDEGEAHSSEHTLTPEPMQGFGSTISQEDHTQFTQDLRSGPKSNLFLDLELSVREQIDTGQYDLGVIDSYRILELWVKHAAEIIMRARGKTQSDIERKLRDDTGDYANLMNIIHNILKDDSDVSYDFTSKQEFQQWESTTYELRNKIVHEGDNATRKDSIDAHAQTGKAIRAFHSDFSSELSGSRCEKVKSLGDTSMIPSKSP